MCSEVFDGDRRSLRDRGICDPCWGDPGDLLTVQETARYLKVSVSWVYEHVRPDAQDRLPAVKLGKYLRFDARDLRAYVDAKRADSQQSGRRR
jgi:excisionase family DNA binding protein